MGRYTGLIKGKEIKKFHDNYTVIDIELLRVQRIKTR